MRARNIKPGFFKNSKLGRLSPHHRLLFEGLWCLADGLGRLKDDPDTIKIEVLPYDDVDADTLLNDLATSSEKFITRYEVDGVAVIQVNNFEKHQNPHPNERKKGSEFPDVSCNVTTSHLNKLPVMMNHESLIMNHDSNTPQPPKGGDTAFEKFWASYPLKVGKAAAKRLWDRKKLGDQLLGILSGIEKYRNSKQWREGFIPNPMTFLNQERWNDEIPTDGQALKSGTKPLYERLLDAGEGVHVFGGTEDEPARIRMEQWVYVPKGYFGSDGLQHKQTGALVPLKSYKVGV